MRPPLPRRRHTLRAERGRIRCVRFGEVHQPRDSTHLRRCRNSVPRQPFQAFPTSDPQRFVPLNTSVFTASHSQNALLRRPWGNCPPTTSPGQRPGGERQFLNVLLHGFTPVPNRSVPHPYDGAFVESARSTEKAPAPRIMRKAAIASTSR